MIARHIRTDSEIDSVNTDLTYPVTSKEWFHEAWMHHKELEMELSNLNALMNVINDSNRKNIEPDISRLINDINIIIRILKKKYYKNLDMDELGSNPMKNLIKNYIDYNSEKLKNVQNLLSKVKFSYN